MREATKELKDLLEYGRMLEMSELQSKGIEEGSNITMSVNRVQKHQPGRKAYQQHTVRHTGSGNTRCRNCGGEWPHSNGCPAKGKQCKACGKLNHFARQCRSTQHTEQMTKAQTHRKNSGRVNQIETRREPDQHEPARRESSSSSDEECYAYTVKSNKDSRQPLTKVTLNGDKVQALIDSSAAVNLISEKTYNNLSIQPCLLHTDLRILAYGSKNALPIIGKFTGCVETRNKRKTDATFYVVRGDGCSLLSYQTADELGLIKIIHSITPPPTNLTVVDQLISNHPELFGGIGKLKDFQVTLHINKDIQPTCQPHQRVPFHLREKVEAERR